MSCSSLVRYRPMDLQSFASSLAAKLNHADEQALSAIVAHILVTSGSFRHVVVTQHVRAATAL
jgi:hypothetical protein